MQRSGIRVLRNPLIHYIYEPVPGFRWRSIQATRLGLIAGSGERSRAAAVGEA